MGADGKLAGKKALVTGSGTGIGREVALEFGRQGADVVLHYSHSDQGAKSAVEELKTLGRNAAAYQADFNIVDEVVGLAERAIDFLGGVDCLVNNAGISFNKPFFKITPEQFDTLFHVNIRAQFFLTQCVVPQMMERGGGAVCNMTSIHGLQGVPEFSLYAGTKGAIIGYTRALAVELAHRGIRINTIAPGWVTVENHSIAMPGLTQDGVREVTWNKIPAARGGLPIDIAKLAAFLCSDDASYIIGQTIVADGGTTALMSLVSDFRSESGSRFGLGYVAGA